MKMLSSVVIRTVTPKQISLGPDIEVSPQGMGSFPAVAAGTPCLALVTDLCKRLNDARVAYCHWKGNAFLHRSAAGDKDLDLLIARADMSRFLEVLCQLQIKPAKARNPDFPGIENYYGFDAPSGKIVHIHAHYRLALGDNLTMNYYIPIEKEFLQSAVQHGSFKVPSPEFEYIVFVLRMTLKYCTWNAWVRRMDSLPHKAQVEMRYLETRVNRVSIVTLLRQQLPFLDPRLFWICARSLQPDRSPWFRIQVAMLLEKHLRAHARRSRTLDVFLKLMRTGVRTVSWRIFNHKPKKRLASGGAVIALVGGDGAGKSTAVAEIHKWLSKDFRALRVHMGRPPLSGTTVAIKAALWAARPLQSLAKQKTGNGHQIRGNSESGIGYGQLLRNACKARDRYRAFVKARRFAANGGVVVTDRFPLRQVKRMDAARSTGIRVPASNRVAWFLVKMEEGYYAQLSRPDVLIVLQVAPEIAARRKPGEDEQFVLMRCEEIQQLNWKEQGAHVVDASQPKERVLAELKSIVWSEI